jgi:hypothetical protein
MKNIFNSTLFALFFLFINLPHEAQADHVLGSEITYKCTSTPGIYEITFIFYRDCSGIPVCPQGCGNACSRTLQILGADAACATTTFGSVSLTLQSVRDVNVNPQCPSTKSICDNMGCVTPGTYTPAAERYEFKGFANVGVTSGIPASCCNIRLVYSECCRSGQIATGATWQNFYIDATINRCLSISPCNSSPEFNEDPGLFTCSGNPAIFSSGATDPDLDSLSYTFTPALQGFGSSVTYDPPYAYDKPLPWTGNANDPFPGGIHCDPLTGDIMFTPPTAFGAGFYGIVAVAVTQWKKINGVPTIIGVTRRDQMITILGSCIPNKEPVLKTDPAAPGNIAKTSWEICAGQQLCFTVIAQDSDSAPALSDTTYLNWDNHLQNMGATFLPTYNIADRHKPAPLGGPREDSYQFCWTPDPSHVSSLPYYFTITGKDNRCPNIGKTNRTFSVKVIGTADIDITKTGDSCGKWLLGYTNHNPLQNLAGTWEIANDSGDYTFAHGSYTRQAGASATPVYFTKKGKYLVKLHIAQQQNEALCGDTTLTDTLDVTSVTSLNGSYTQTNASCYGLHDGEISITASAGSPPYLYRISGHLYNNAVNTFGNLGANTYTAWVRDMMGCESVDTVKITQPDRILTSAIGGNRTAETGTILTYTITTQPGVSLFWNTTGTIMSGQGTSSLTVKWETEGIHMLKLTATDGACSDSAFINVQVETPTGLNELARQWGLEVYPNPVKNELTISLDRLPEHCTIELYDMQGKKIIEQPLKSRQQLETSLLSKGIYILKIGDWRGQVIKQ